MPFTVLDHTADLHMRIEAATLEDLFVEAARGMVGQMFPNTLSERQAAPGKNKEIHPQMAKKSRNGGSEGGSPESPQTTEGEWREITVYVADSSSEIENIQTSQWQHGESVPLSAFWEDLFHDWLSKVLIMCTGERLLPLAYKLAFEKNGLRAQLFVRPLDPERDGREIEIKAVTYHGLSIERTPQGYRAEVIFDT